MNELHHRSQQVTDGLWYFTGAFSIIFITFMYYYELRFDLLKHARLPITHSPLYLLGILLDMVLLNPLLDEWLWRVFYLKSMPDTYLQKVGINIFYASYHGVILFYCQGLFSALVGISSYMSLAASLTFIRERHGFITCVITHLGINFALMLVLADVSFHIQTHPTDFPLRMRA